MNLKPFVRENRKTTKGNVVSIHSQKNSRVMLCEPRSYEETQEIAVHLRARRSTVVTCNGCAPIRRRGSSIF